MKIAILTHPLWTNYGGILQAYALQTFLQRCGHEVTVINREYRDYPSITLFCLRLASSFKTFLRVYILGQKQFVVKSPLSAFYNNQWTGYDVLPFVKQYINQSRELRNSNALRRYFKRHKYDCYVVGSDQVWRPCYVASITDYFLKEISNKENSIKIAYAASFGVDHWEFSQEETRECANLVKIFDAVSVREKSGVKLCKDFLDIEAQHMLDPTMLLSVEDYMKLMRAADTVKSDGDVFCYVLDQSLEVKQVIDDISQKGYTPFSASIIVAPTSDNPRPLQMSVEQWLCSINDAKLVVTDSFHACVFSILFKKPFIVLANKNRGCSRFESLLETFGLQHRLIYSYSDYLEREEELIDNSDLEKSDTILDTRRRNARSYFHDIKIL